MLTRPIRGLLLVFLILPVISGLPNDSELLLVLVSESRHIVKEGACEGGEGEGRGAVSLRGKERGNGGLQKGGDGEEGKDGGLVKTGRTNDGCKRLNIASNGSLPYTVVNKNCTADWSMLSPKS